MPNPQLGAAIVHLLPVGYYECFDKRHSEEASLPDRKHFRLDVLKTGSFQ